MATITISKCVNCGIGHEWDFDVPTLKEMRQIKKLTGLAGQDFAQASEAMDPEAIAALLYVMHKRDKITIPFDDIDINFTDFHMTETEEEKKEREAMQAQGEADPTKTRSGRTPKAA